MCAARAKLFLSCILLIFLIRSHCVTARRGLGYAEGSQQTFSRSKFSLDHNISDSERLTKYEGTHERQ